MSSSLLIPEQQSQPHELECECDEPNGMFLRRVYLLPMSKENMFHFWEKARQYPILFGKEISNDFEKFLSIFFGQTESGDIFIKGIIWILDYYVGAFYLTDITDTDATIHFTFFDGRIKGRLNLGKAVIKYLFDKFMFQRLNAAIPEYVSPATMMFTKKLGFTEEGIKRGCVKYHKNPDYWYNMYLFGIVNHQEKGDFKRWASQMRKITENLPKEE